MQQDVSYAYKYKVDVNDEAWYVMQDTKPRHANNPAYKMLREAGFEVYTPMCWRLVKRNKQLTRKETPILPDLVFVHSTRTQLDPIVDRTRTLLYRYVKGGVFKEAMTVGDNEMRRFINAAENYGNPIYYTVDEITPHMYGRKVRIIGGPLDGHEVPLLKKQGSKKKRIIVELPMLMAVSVEVSPDFIELVKPK